MLQVVGFPTEVIVRLPPAVRELTFRPDISSLKLPEAVLGTNPAIKLSAAGVQVGVNGAAPYWLAAEMRSAAGAELVRINKVAKIKFATSFHFSMRVFFINFKYSWPFELAPIWIFGFENINVDELDFLKHAVRRSLIQGWQLSRAKVPGSF